jgi:hypothetical protein
MDAGSSPATIRQNRQSLTTVDLLVRNPLVADLGAA